MRLLSSATITQVITLNPYATDSPDFSHPWGTVRDNTTCSAFWNGLSAVINKSSVSVLDLGCAGGGLVIEGAALGHDTIGLEGSDYWTRHIEDNCQSAYQWKRYKDQRLFNCDITQPFFIIGINFNVTAENNQTNIFINPTISYRKFDVVMAWEVLEHLSPLRLQVALGNIYNHMADDGIFIASISMVSDTPEGVELHQIRKPIEWWLNEIMKYGLFKCVEPYPFEKLYPPRAELSSFFVLVRKNCFS